MKSLLQINQDKRKKRRMESSEDFTPRPLVNEMLDKIEKYSPNIFINSKKTFIDPACGNGNILIEVLKRKLNHVDPIQAISTIYGCDIFRDNIKECRLRLFKTIREYKKTKLVHNDYVQIYKYLAKNIVHVPLTKFPNGSLDYLKLPREKIFNNSPSIKRCSKILGEIVSKKMLNGVEIA
jgi:hypothetical protein